MAINYRKCEGRSDCASEQEILQWLRNKYIVILYNQIRFDAGQFFEESAVSESRIVYIPISSQIRQIVPFKVTQTSAELRDNPVIDMDKTTMHTNDELFTLVQQKNLPYEKFDNVHLSVRVEVDSS